MTSAAGIESQTPRSRVQCLNHSAIWSRSYEQMLYTGAKFIHQNLHVQFVPQSPFDDLLEIYGHNFPSLEFSQIRRCLLLSGSRLQILEIGSIQKLHAYQNL